MRALGGRRGDRRYRFGDVLFVGAGTMTDRLHDGDAEGHGVVLLMRHDRRSGEGVKSACGGHRPATEMCWLSDIGGLALRRFFDRCKASLNRLTAPSGLLVFSGV